jgi:GNAT superfamily N-acetyltransferase
MKFEVRSILVVEQVDNGLGGLKFREELIEKPYVKDYDSYEDQYADDSESGPESWPRHFDISNWHIYMAFSREEGEEGERPLGGAAIAYNTDGVNMLEGRDDIAVLWDIRVHPDHAGKGIGTQLFNHAVEWAREKGCKQLKIETQNVNVPACRFYAKQGCYLGQIHRHGYYGHPEVGHEVMLIWYLDL